MAAIIAAAVIIAAAAAAVTFPETQVAVCSIMRAVRHTLLSAGHGYDRDSRREDVRRDERDRRAPAPASANFDRRDRCEM